MLPVAVAVLFAASLSNARPLRVMLGLRDPQALSVKRVTRGIVGDEANG